MAATISTGKHQLTGRALLVAGASMSGALFAACSTAGAPDATRGANTGGATSVPAASGNGEKFLGVRLPTYIPRELVKPDFPSNDPNLSPGYDTYPAISPKANPTTPGKGGEVSAYMTAYFPPPSPMEHNSAWQEVNKQLGVTVRFAPISMADNQAKFSTMMAGNDVPDFIHMFQGWTLAVRSLPQFIESTCADLTPYFSGDAIKAFPNLAAIPPLAWKQAIYHGKILALPLPAPPSFNRVYYSTTVYDAVIGKDVVPKNADDFKRILQLLTSAKDGRYGYVVNTTWDMFAFSRIFGAPNYWRLDGGKLVYTYETEQYRATVGYLRDLWAAGVIYPDSFTFVRGSPQIQIAMTSGNAVMGSQTTAMYAQIQRLGAPHNQSFRAYKLFSADGAKPVFFNGAGVAGLTAVKKGSSERVQELLNVMNWLAAPFGSEEDRLLRYGIAGTDYTVDNKGNPIPTERGPADSTYVPWRFLASRPYVLYDPSVPNYAPTSQADEKDSVPFGISNATDGLYSATAATSGVTLAQRVEDGVTEIVRGLRPISDLDQLVKDWQSGGGDKMRTEYQQAQDSAG